MLHLRNINPMVRAVGTMGAVSALVGGITFAQLTSNTVALSPNTLSASSSGSSAHLQIGLTNGTTSGLATSATTTTTGTTNSSTTCANAQNGSVPGFDLTGANSLAPGQTSAPLDFCLANTGTVPLDLTVNIPQGVFAGDQGIPANAVKLNITCDNGGSTNTTLDQYDGTNMLGTLAAGSSTSCAATLKLKSGFTPTSSNESIPSFKIQFMGTESGTNSSTGDNDNDSDDVNNTSAATNTSTSAATTDTTNNNQ